MLTVIGLTLKGGSRRENLEQFRTVCFKEWTLAMRNVNLDYKEQLSRPCSQPAVTQDRPNEPITNYLLLCEHCQIEDFQSTAVWKSTHLWVLSISKMIIQLPWLLDLVLLKLCLWLSSHIFPNNKISKNINPVICLLQFCATLSAVLAFTLTHFSTFSHSPSLPNTNYAFKITIHQRSYNDQNPKLWNILLLFDIWITLL